MSIKLTSQDEFRRIADTILRTSKADDTVVNFSDSRSSTLRFANNQVVQNVSVDQTSVSVEVAYRGDGIAEEVIIIKDSGEAPGSIAYLLER